MAMVLGVMFIWGSHPLLMMGGLVILVLMGFLYLYYELSSFWIGYLLLLVMLSGILVIFSYMLSLIPNLAFESFSMFIPLMFLCVSGHMYWNKFNVIDMSLYIYSLWASMLKYTTFYLVSLLLLLMVIVLYLSIMSSGSLRVF
uniref:NADH dehydrogenase subunit 6 n=1 Tax=Tetragnatha cf. tincochacae DDC-2018 TaxID=2067681 RepID=A0A2I6BYP6_9ARAC|nr:NADH dehydrogenase subunit 6 [Tetragnatha cf. tincochacae DDC-2018]